MAALLKHSLPSTTQLPVSSISAMWRSLLVNGGANKCLQEDSQNIRFSAQNDVCLLKQNVVSVHTRDPPNVFFPQCALSSYVFQRGTPPHSPDPSAFDNKAMSSPNGSGAETTSIVVTLLLILLSRNVLGKSVLVRHVMPMSRFTSVWLPFVKLIGSVRSVFFIRSL